jgi:hypothetical protein
MSDEIQTASTEPSPQMAPALVALEAELTSPKTGLGIKEVLDAAIAAENKDISHIMAMQMNVIVEANLRLRGQSALTYQDMMAYFRIVKFVLAPPPLPLSGRPAR